jgi:hypothetical protein
MLTMELMGNSAPSTAMSVLTGPEAGDEDADALVVKRAMTELVPSLTATAWEPFVLAGTVNEALTLPVALLVTVSGEVATATPSYVMVMVVLAVKPLPATVTAVPMAPESGPMDIPAPTVKVWSVT